MTKERLGPDVRSWLRTFRRRVPQWVLFVAFGAKCCARNEHWVRIGRIAPWVCRVVSYVLFVTSLYPALCLVDWLCDFRAGSSAGLDAVALMVRSELIASILFAACTVVLAYIPARLLYVLTTFRLDVEETLYCRRCSYNLTGNVSGICPECGTPVEQDQPERLRLREIPNCQHCSYDLTGNVSGVCPECGMPIPEQQTKEVDGGATSLRER